MKKSESTRDLNLAFNKKKIKKKKIENGGNYETINTESNELNKLNRNNDKNLDLYQNELYKTLSNFKNNINKVFDRFDEINNAIDNRYEKLKSLKNEEDELIDQIEKKRYKKISELILWYDKKKEEMKKNIKEAIKKLEQKFDNIYPKYDYEKYYRIKKILENQKERTNFYNEENDYDDKLIDLETQKQKYINGRNHEFLEIKQNLINKFYKYFKYIESQEKKSIKAVQKDAKNEIDNIKKEYASKEEQLKLDNNISYEKNSLFGLDKYLEKKKQKEEDLKYNYYY